ncbi:conserved unknown protein [Ectocarpus siliculosus]|uniref:AB hydrolase-1 domain-containing protein n=1 Tax=Ectocarpus siliculosus TaxID=2880 RepID=D8LGP8_ECTSI|nr:conserved unknown protein [Ectocarpus siliculosus]|eukprot:CBN79068.1 conserved unknown protein [Ectocarpus siliculosus]
MGQAATREAGARGEAPATTTTTGGGGGGAAEVTIAAAAAAAASSPVLPLATSSSSTSTSSEEEENNMAAAAAAKTPCRVTLRESLAKMRWTASSLDSLRSAEERLFSALNLNVFDADIGSEQHIHTVEGGKGKSEIPVVLCHGYGMGVGGWHLNLGELTASTHVMAKDWLGCGLSSRPRWDLEGVKETEAFFVDSLERWRQANEVDKMVLCGHSLGGYLSVCYAEKYPQRIDKLVLASPVGFPEEPEGFREAIESRPFAQRNLMKFVGWGWAKGITPGDVVRTMGPLGYRMMMGYSNRRFQQAEFDKRALGDYLYHNLAATHGSGERALSRVLKPGAWAHSPLKHRLPKLDPSVPVHFMFGDRDWMNSTAPQELLESARADGGSGQEITITTVPNAGHQLFLDNPRGFNAELLRLCGVDVDPAAADAAYAATQDAVAQMAAAAAAEEAEG